ncbi:hypothetical protein NC652_010552 [Populus alba x Populus x berolinensis]|uniref:Uncharacterized protein n=1 Tax=Populus alba x Populus x berolinensis TaxID=444605 RepID=A0AAD6W5C2_9ROSI|nr:hypothetical protein NC652_010552 [Populus alba x Populus x berolinensis]KAJ6999873.1 hypothetical protein NC653_010581 [Populus alba x Populus x berolinensis]
MMELLLLGCTGVVVFLHGANFFFHILSHHFASRSLRALLGLDLILLIIQRFKTGAVSWDLLDDKANKKESRDDLLISSSKLLMIKIVSALVHIAN